MTEKNIHASVRKTKRCASSRRATMFSLSLSLSLDRTRKYLPKREKEKEEIKMFLYDEMLSLSLSLCVCVCVCLTFACAFSGSKPMLGSRSGSCPFGAFLAPNANVRTRSPRLKVVFALIDDDDDDDDARPRGVCPIIEDTKGRAIIIPDEEEDIARRAVPNLLTTTGVC